MKTLLRPLLITALSVLGTAPLAAQGITGNWITEFERSIRNENGTVSAGEKARARMTLKQQGDSVTGTWEAVGASDPSRPARPRPLRGTIAGNKVQLVAEFEATVNINGDESVRKITMRYDFTVNGDALDGTVQMGSGDMPARPFSARREGKS